MGPPYKWPEINGPHNCFFFFNPYKWRDTQAPYNWYGRGPSCWVDFGVFWRYPVSHLKSWEPKVPPQSYPPQEIASPNKALLKLKETNG